MFYIFAGSLEGVKRWKTQITQPALLLAASTELGMYLESTSRGDVLVLRPPWYEGGSKKVVLGHLGRCSWEAPLEGVASTW